MAKYERRLIRHHPSEDMEQFIVSSKGHVVRYIHRKGTRRFKRQKGEDSTEVLTKLLFSPTKPNPPLEGEVEWVKERLVKYKQVPPELLPNPAPAAQPVAPSPVPEPDSFFASKRLPEAQLASVPVPAAPAAVPVVAPTPAAPIAPNPAPAATPPATPVAPVENPSGSKFHVRDEVIYITPDGKRVSGTVYSVDSEHEIYIRDDKTHGVWKADPARVKLKSNPPEDIGKRPPRPQPAPALTKENATVVDSKFMSWLDSGDDRTGDPDPVALSDAINIFETNKPADALTLVKQKYGAEVTFKSTEGFTKLWVHKQAGQQGGDLSYIFCHLYQNPYYKKELQFVWGRIGNTTEWKIVLPKGNPPAQKYPYWAVWRDYATGTERRIIVRSPTARKLRASKGDFVRTLADPVTEADLKENPLAMADPVAFSDVINIFEVNTPDQALRLVKEKYGTEVTFNHELGHFGEVWVHKQAGHQGGSDMSYIFCHLFQNSVDKQELRFVWGRIGNATHWKIVLPKGNPPVAENPQTTPDIKSEIYTRLERPRGYTADVTPLSAHGSDGGLMLRRRLPGWTKDDHMAAATHHNEMSEAMDAEWYTVVNEAAMKLWGRKFDMTRDYKISGIGSDEFPPETKDKLRYLSHTATAHGDAGVAHLYASGKRTPYHQVFSNPPTEENPPSSTKIPDTEHWTAKTPYPAANIIRIGTYEIYTVGGNQRPYVNVEDKLKGRSDQPIRYPNGSIAYDHPEWWPSYVKTAVKQYMDGIVATNPPTAENPRKKQPELGGSVVIGDAIPSDPPRYHGKSMLRCAECKRKIGITTYDGQKAAVCRVHGTLNYAFLVDKDKTDIFAKREINDPGDVVLLAPFFTSSVNLMAALQTATMQDGDKYLQKEIRAFVSVFEEVEKSGDWDSWEQKANPVARSVYDRLHDAIVQSSMSKPPTEENPKKFDSYVLWGTRKGEPKWAEQVIVDTANKDKLKAATEWAKKNGFVNLRVVGIDMSEAPDFLAALDNPKEKNPPTAENPRKPITRWYHVGYYIVKCVWNAPEKEWNCEYYIDGRKSYDKAFYVGDTSWSTPEKELVQSLSRVMNESYPVKKLTEERALAINEIRKALIAEDEEIKAVLAPAGYRRAGSTIVPDTPDNIESTAMYHRGLGDYPMLIRRPLRDKGSAVIEYYHKEDGPAPAIQATDKVILFFDVSIEEAQKRYELAQERKGTSFSPAWPPQTEYGRKMQADYDKWLATQPKTNPPAHTLTAGEVINAVAKASGGYEAVISELVSRGYSRDAAEAGIAVVGSGGYIWESGQGRLEVTMGTATCKNPPAEVPVIDAGTGEAEREQVDLEENGAQAKLNPVPSDPSLCGMCFKPVDPAQRYLRGETSRQKYHVDCDPRKAKDNPPDPLKCGVCGEKMAEAQVEQKKVV